RGGPEPAPTRPAGKDAGAPPSTKPATPELRPEHPAADGDLPPHQPEHWRRTVALGLNGPGGEPFEAALKEPGVLIGFYYRVAGEGAAQLTALKPIFRAAEGEITLDYLGEPTGTSRQVVA